MKKNKQISKEQIDLDTFIYAPINIYRILKQRNIYFKNAISEDRGVSERNASSI